MRRHWTHFAALFLTLAVSTFLIVPIVLSALAGVMVNYAAGPSAGFTLAHVAAVWSEYHDTVALSAGIAFAALIVCTLLGVPAAYALVTSRSRWARAFEELVTLPLAIPGLALALALLECYGGIRPFRTNWTFILVGHVVFTLPFMLRAVAAVLASIDLRTLEEGAASLGAGFFERFRTIVVPNALPGIVAGGLMVFTLSIGEFNITWMLHTPYLKTLPVGLADAYASARLETASAYTLIFLLLIVPVLAALQAAAKRTWT